MLSQSVARSVREISTPAHRGMIMDRNGEPIAISIPVASIWINPKMFSVTATQLRQLSAALNLFPSELKQKILKHGSREFVYLKRDIPMETGENIVALHIPGVFLLREYKRYYPEADAMAQVVGFPNVDDKGQEGLELAYDQWLRGVPGEERVVKDRLGHIVANLGVVKEPQQGKDLVLSIDKRVQYLAYHELKNAIEEHQAESGSVVVLDTKTGEVLAMTNMPIFNPNNRVGISPSFYRNRAVTDLFEPGSTMKAFSVALALQSGKYKPTTMIDTNPGYYVLEGHKIYDDEHINHGVLTLTEVLKKSSDIGITKMVLTLQPDSLLNMLRSLGFAQSTDSGFPGEAVGTMPDRVRGRPFVLATLGFGYGISVTALQLARAYAVIASNGVLLPISFIKTDQAVTGKQVLSRELCQKMLAMLEAVLDIGGTGKRAKIPGFRVAGKTGTAHIAKPHGYYSDRYFSVFVGIAPVSDPRLVVAVVIKNPRGQYKGALVAAPTFANIMEGALRVLNITPDDIGEAGAA